MDSFPILVILFCFGLIIGSFLNVVILRSGTGMSISKGRSKCFSCGKTLAWYELIPLVSFLIQRGRCTVCGSKISAQYFLVELASALALPAVFLAVPVTDVVWENFAIFVIAAVILCLYIIITVYDFRHKMIPDRFSYAAAGATLLAIIVSSIAHGSIDWSYVAAGPILFLFFFFFWAVSKGRWMGLGDAKLALSVGWFLGLSKGVAAILLAFWIGAVVTVLIICIQRIVARFKKHHHSGLGMKSEVPFGPFIILGFLIVFISALDTQLLLSFLAL